LTSLKTFDGFFVETRVCVNAAAASPLRLRPKPPGRGAWSKVNPCVFIDGHNSRGHRPASFKHGMTGSRTYISWIEMNRRCVNLEDKNYGGKGIKVCERWHSSNPNGFVNFLADMGERPPGTTNGRFGDMGNYEPGNCKWMTRAEQQNNRRLKKAA
jgi:hypothetical protein